MIQQLIYLLDWFGVFVFSATGALVASRKEMDLLGFALLGSVTGIGGGTIRDLILGVQPIFGLSNRPISLLALSFQPVHFSLRMFCIIAIACCSGLMLWAWRFLPLRDQAAPWRTGRVR